MNIFIKSINERNCSVSTKFILFFNSSNALALIQILGNNRNKWKFESNQLLMCLEHHLTELPSKMTFAILLVRCMTLQN